MRCEECRTLVEDYFDGELDEAGSLLLAQHLDACRPCASLYEQLEQERELYLRYECDAQPAPAFWDNVIERAREEQSSRTSESFPRLRAWLANGIRGFGVPRFSPSLTALIVLVAVAVTVLLMTYVGRNERGSDAVSISQARKAPVEAAQTSANSGQPDKPQEQTNPGADDETGGKENQASVNEKATPVQNGSDRRGRQVLTAASATTTARETNAERIGRKPLPAGQSRTADELVREAEQKYVAAIAMLSRDVNRRRSQLDPETAARFERTLSAVDRTIADTRRAARRHPNDPVAAQYMLTAYAKKVEVLREMIGY